MASKGTNLTSKADPTISSASVASGFPEGTHPVAPISEQTWGAPNLQYRDVPDDRKPDPSSVVQEQIRPGEDA